MRGREQHISTNGSPDRKQKIVSAFGMALCLLPAWRALLRYLPSVLLRVLVVRAIDRWQKQFAYIAAVFLTPAQLDSLLAAIMHWLKSSPVLAPRQPS